MRSALRPCSHRLMGKLLRRAAFGLVVAVAACGGVSSSEPAPLEDAGLLDAAASDAGGPNVEADADALDASLDVLADAGADAALDGDADAGSEVVTQIAPSAHRTCFLFSSGRVKCAGLNKSGGSPRGNAPTTLKLGDGLAIHNPYPCPSYGLPIDCSAVPVLVAGLTDAVEVSAGGTATCARRAGGSVVCWGENEEGQLGDGTITSRATPGAVSGLVDAVQIAAGETGACARRATGAVVCWGANTLGTLGDGTTAIRQLVPAAVVGLSDAIGIAFANLGGCAIRAGGSVVCWGANSLGQLGDGLTHEACSLGSQISDCSRVPVPVPGINDATAISRSTRHVCVRRTTGTVSCWGGGDEGELGDGLRTKSAVPVNVLNMNNATSITVAYRSTCALRSGGQVACWGFRADGALGVPIPDPPEPGPASPNDIPGLTDAISLAGNSLFGGTARCAMRPLGRISCWGDNRFGGLANGTTAQKHTPTDVVF